MSTTRKVSLAAAVSAAFLAGILFTTAGSNLIGEGDRIGIASHASDVSTGPDPTRTLPPLPAGTSDLEASMIAVAERVNPAVVQIRSEKAIPARQVPNPFEGSPFENFFQGRPDMPEQFSQALGSGVIVRSNGFILTNNHVVAEADELEVRLFDGTYADAEVIGTDPESDLAVIRIRRDGLPTVPYGDIDAVRVGQFALAFGSPLSEDLGNTVTSGIVSAVGRTSNNLARLNISSFIQTDAAINPGNSGGPLVNLRGELIGLNSAIYSRSGGSQGIGFAIPVDVVLDVANQLVDGGEVERGYLGIRYGPVSPALARAFDVPRGAAQVTRIEDDGPARVAGLLEGDVIVAVDGRDLQDDTELRVMVARKRPGDRVRLSVVRDGDRRAIDIELGTRPNLLARAETREPGSSADELDQLGFQIRALSDELRRELGVDGSLRGVVVVNVNTGSAAYREAELRRGDIITEVDRNPVSSTDEFLTAYRGVTAGDAFIVKVVRMAGEDATTLVTALEKPR